MEDNKYNKHNLKGHKTNNCLYCTYCLLLSLVTFRLLGGEVAGVIFPFGDEGGHVGRELAVEVHLLAGLGMNEAEGFGMQGLAGAQFEAVVDELGVAR